MERIKKELLVRKEELLWNKSQWVDALQDRKDMIRTINIFCTFFSIIMEFLPLIAGPDNYKRIWEGGFIGYSIAIIFSNFTTWCILYGVAVKYKCKETRILLNNGEKPNNYEYGLIVTREKWYIKDDNNFTLESEFSWKLDRKDISIVRTK